MKNPSVSFRSLAAAALCTILLFAAAGPLAASTPLARVIDVAPRADAAASVAQTHATLLSGYAAYHPTAAVRRANRRVASRNTELAQARTILAGLRATYRYTDGATVRFGTVPGNYDAIAYVANGDILINAKHTMSLRFLITHELWHVIDWRDNGRMDWAESIPPRNYASYRR